METGLKSLSLPHKRVLITSPDRRAFGKRGVDFRPGGSAEFQRSATTPGAAAAKEGGRAARTNRLIKAENVLSFYLAAL